MLVGEVTETGFGTVMDMNKLAMLPGKERDLAEFDTLIQAAGLRRTALTQLQPPYCIIEAVAG
jgi:hypothetical protein